LSYPYQKTSAIGDVAPQPDEPCTQTMNDTINTRKPQRISITVPWQVYQTLQANSNHQGRSLSNLASHWLELQAQSSSSADGSVTASSS